MIKEVIMPKLGQTMEEGTIERWLKKEGDPVSKGDVLFEVTTDKATLEVESYSRGLLRKVLVKEGETVPVMQIVAFIGDLDDEIPSVDSRAGAGRATEAEKVKVEENRVVKEEAKKKVGMGRIKASPLARKLAAEKGVDLSKVSGTGPGGRITKEDILGYAERGGAAVAAGEEKAVRAAVPLSGMRRAIAQHMVTSKREIPHFYVTVEVDMEEVVEMRKWLLPLIESETEKRLSYTHIIVKAVAHTLKEFPRMRMSWQEGERGVAEQINIGIAVAVDDGLIVPVLKDADQKKLSEIVLELDRILIHAREKKLTADEYSGSIFTISNLGMYPVDNFIPIINYPESAILGISTIQEKVVVFDGDIEIRQHSKFTLSADHRVLDGVIVAQFLSRLKEILENPQELII